MLKIDGKHAIQELCPSNTTFIILHNSETIRTTIGDPFPTLIGINLDYNLMSFFRLTAGYGNITASSGSDSASLTTIGGGARLFVPGWNFSPMAGLSVSQVTFSVTSGSLSQDVGGFSTNDRHVYATLGVDWQASTGFNLGLGYNYSLKSGIGGIGFLNLGWFF